MLAFQVIAVLIGIAFQVASVVSKTVQGLFFERTAQDSGCCIDIEEKLQDYDPGRS
jgi:hypothetical protein